MIPIRLSSIILPICYQILLFSSSFLLANYDDKPKEKKEYREELLSRAIVIIVFGKSTRNLSEDNDR